MANLLKYILFLCIWNSILFFNKDLGLNVILYIIPIILFITYVLKKNNKINNNKGLLFIIPIIIISCTYFIYDNLFFKILNTFMITLLLILLYIYTIKPTYNITEILKNIILLVFVPFSCIKNLYNIIYKKIDNNLKLTNSNKKKLKSIIIVLPVIIIVLILLSSADMIFNNIFSNFFKLFNSISINNIIARLILIIILFIYMGSVINYLLFDYSNIKDENNSKFNIENYTIKLLLTLLNIIYIIFDIIQIRSLIFHKVSININYAEYAREGFFQLMFISLINLIIILLSKKTNNNEYDKYKKTMSILMIILTLIIICSSFIRMYMYESTYGYTLLRLLVYFILITEIVLLIPTIIYILKPQFNIVKSYIIIICTMYTILSILPINYIIANNNINRYYKTNKLDLYYLQNYSTDNVPLLIELYNKADDRYLKREIKSYMIEIKNNIKNNDLREFNISKYKANKFIKNKELNENSN